MAGDFQGFKCDVNEPKPVITFIFFSVYIVLTSWVIMSLFIGVISMGMFEAFEAMKAESKNSRYAMSYILRLHLCSYSISVFIVFHCYACRCCQLLAALHFALNFS